MEILDLFQERKNMKAIARQFWNNTLKIRLTQIWKWKKKDQEIKEKKKRNLRAGFLLKKETFI